LYDYIILILINSKPPTRYPVPALNIREEWRKKKDKRKLLVDLAYFNLKKR